MEMTITITILNPKTILQKTTTCEQLEEILIGLQNIQKKLKENNLGHVQLNVNVEAASWVY